MSDEKNAAYYARQAQQQLDLAAAATDPSTKARHLDSAARFATSRELAARAELSSAKARDAKGE